VFDGGAFPTAGLRAVWAWVRRGERFEDATMYVSRDPRGFLRLEEAWRTVSRWHRRLEQAPDARVRDASGRLRARS
jgi:hypothetical protein